MSARRGPARGLGALLLLCLLLAGAVAVESRYPAALILQVGTPGDGAPAAPGPGADGDAEPDPYRPPGETDFQVIELRPLFAPDRRPPEAGSGAQTDGPAAPSSLDGLVLTGIIGAGSEWVAIVEPAGPPRPGSEAVALHIGDNVRGWTVEAIAADRIVLVDGTLRFEMELTDDPARRRRGKARQPPAAAGTLRTPGRTAPQPAPQQQLQPELEPQLEQQLQLQPLQPQQTEQ